jgi:sulfur carrier protein
MKVFVNNEEKELSPEHRLSDLLEQSGIITLQGIAVAVNNAVVSRSRWSAYTLQPNDKITVITATQGG